MQLVLFEPRADVESVWLRCPGCGHHWRFAELERGAWWSRGLSAAALARMPWCPACEHEPPMQIAEAA